MVKISLLPTEKKIPAGEKFLNFCLTFGRYIVIGTEIIVFSCFLARFRLDHQLEQLSESIQQKQAIVQSFAAREQKIRLLQTQLASLKEIKATKKDPNAFFQNLVDLLPAAIFLEEVTLKQNKVYLTATAYSSQDLAVFLNQILLSENFKQPTLGQVVVEKGEIKFSLSARLTLEVFQ